jgi:hypothetical protein
MSETNTVSPLRQHMIEDLAARKLNPHTQRSYIHSCKRFEAQKLKKFDIPERILALSLKKVLRTLADGVDRRRVYRRRAGDGRARGWDTGGRKRGGA